MNSFVSDILPSEFLEKYVGKQPKWGFGGLGYLVYKRTYARELPDESGTEEWWQTIARCINGAQKIGASYTPEEAQRLFQYMFDLKCSYAGRMLWQLGTSTVDRFGMNSLINCYLIAIKDYEAFCFLFENLMLGGGVGFSVRREDVHELPRVKRGVNITHQGTKDADFIVPDSREGWVRLLRKVLKSYFETGESFTYSTIVVRGYGEKISGFGGTASGPAVLIDGIEKICKVLQEREGRKLRSVDALDIGNIIGSVVVAGNVRRTAEIAMGDADDILFLRAKRWDKGGIPSWRAMSNNTIYADSYDYIMKEVWDGYEGNGEPYGFFNLNVASKFGRLGEERKDNCVGMNPCGEIPLADGEVCNLSEIFLNNLKSEEEFHDCIRLLYKTQKAVCAGKFIHKKTEAIVHKNMRIGIGVTGICQSFDKHNWFDSAYRMIRKYDEEYSKEKGYNKSIRLTTVKPSGTTSLLAGSTPGVNPGFAHFYIRRIRMASNDRLVNLCREAGYHIEYVKHFDGTDDRGTVVVEFPCQLPDDAIVARDVSAVDQMELVKKMQTLWADNSVSVTVYYRKEELPEIKEWLSKNYDTSIKSISFLLHSDHGFAQAPYEEITEEEYNRRIKGVKPINSLLVNTIGSEVIDGIECEGACPLR